MKLRYSLIALVCLATISCDKAKELSNQARSTVKEKLAKKASPSSGDRADPELQKLVDQTSEGAIFRKDLPFPNKLEVKTTRNEEFSGRMFQKSELGSQVGTLKGTFTEVTKLQRSGDEVSYSLIQSTFTEPLAAGADDSTKPVVKELAPASKPIDFVRIGSAWKPANKSDFRTASLSQTISPVFDQLLLENALAPRVLWFGKKRFKIGDQLLVSGKTLPMLVTGNAEGDLKLTLDAFESVKGHPCGLFSVSGTFKRNQFPDFDGSLTNEEVTIESGKFWLSLLYPLILKEEVSIIQTIHNGGQGGLATRGQGSSTTSVEREWKKL